MGAALTGRKNCLAKIKICIYSFLNLYFAPHTFINCKAASTQRLYLMHWVGRVVPVPPRIMTKLWYCDITRRSVVIEQERSHAITSPRPSNAVRKGKSLRTAAFQARRYQSESGWDEFKSVAERIWLLRQWLLLRSYRFANYSNCCAPLRLYETSSMATSVR